MATVHGKRTLPSLSIGDAEPVVKKAPSFNPRTHRLLMCLNKIRASLAIGGPLFSAGRYKQSKALFTRVIKELVSQSNRQYLADEQIETFEVALCQSAKAGLAEDAQTWILRMALDAVYDSNVTGVIGNDGVYFRPFYLVIRESLNKALSVDDDNADSETIADLTKVVNDALSDDSLQLPPAVVRSLEEVRSVSEGDKIKRLKMALFTLYDVIRLPDLNSANRKDVTKSIGEGGKLKTIADFCELEKQNIYPRYSSYIITDSVMGGMSSASFFQATSDLPYALFTGNLSSVNGGGFASVRFVPEDKALFHSAVDTCKGFVVVMKSLGSDPLKVKMKLSSEKRMRAFNWQSEITVPCSDFAEIKVDINSFWPNLFGHVVSDKGTVDFNKVDSIGFIISRLSEDGTSNQSFNEGNFKFAIKSIAVMEGRCSA